MLVGGGWVMGQAIPAGNPVHPLFLDRLEAATAKARAALGNQPFDVGPLPGQDNRPDNHAYGIAIDIVALANPYVMNEKDEPDVDAKTAPVYERIATTMLGRSTVITPHKGKDEPTALQTATYEQIAEENDAMVAYFSVLKKPDDPDAPPPPKNAPKLAVAAQVDVRPHVRPRGPGRARRQSGPGRLRRVDRARRAASSPSRAADLESFLHPARGFLTIRKEVVDAFRGEKLRWGATDFGGASGDVMHFDDGNRHGDYERYGREHPTAKRQAEAAAGDAAPAPPVARNAGARRSRAPNDRRRARGPSGRRHDGRAAGGARERLERERANLHVSTIEPEDGAPLQPLHGAHQPARCADRRARGNSTLADTPPSSSPSTGATSR